MVEDRQMTDDELDMTMAGDDTPAMPEDMAKRLEAAGNELEEYKKREAGWRHEALKERESRQSFQAEANALKAAMQTAPQYPQGQVASEMPPEIDPTTAAYFRSQLENFGQNLLRTVGQAYEADQKQRVGKRMDELEWRANTPDYAAKTSAFEARLSSTPEGQAALAALKSNPQEFYALANSLSAPAPEAPAPRARAPVATPYNERGDAGTPPEPGRIIPFMPAGQTGVAPQSASSEQAMATAMQLFRDGKITGEQLKARIPDLDGDEPMR